MNPGGGRLTGFFLKTAGIIDDGFVDKLSTTVPDDITESNLEGTAGSGTLNGYLFPTLRLTD